MSIKKILDNCRVINGMTNDDPIEKLKKECENNEELREEVKEITGIFLRAIIKYVNPEDCEAVENETK